jgi:vacuolar-type H+-ATPase subunit D/Vma8
MYKLKDQIKLKKKFEKLLKATFKQLIVAFSNLAIYYEEIEDFKG